MAKLFIHVYTLHNTEFNTHLTCILYWIIQTILNIKLINPYVFLSNGIWYR